MNTAFLRAALAGAALLTVSGVASAADMYRKAPPAAPVVAPITAYNWTGFYAGANLGGEWLRDKMNNGTASATVTPGSVTGGLQAGYNFQTGPWVLGAEADVGYSRPTKSNAVGRVEKDWSGTLRARAGYAFDNVLLYGTGGLAVANFKLDDNTAALRRTTTRAGWTLGAGAEVAFTKNISVKGEYLYADFGKARVGAVDHDLNDHTVRVGVNYKF
jgi:outer membrane immunogenic protein